LGVNPSQQKTVLDPPDLTLSLPEHMAILPLSLDGGRTMHVRSSALGSARHLRSQTA